jgi:triacylglycerol lipase
MGGLICRYYLQRLGGISRTQTFIAISSPHRGTWTALFRRNPGTRQMRWGSAFLEDLNRDVHMLKQIRTLSIRTPLDLMIVPSHSSILGRCHTVNVLAHPLMLSDNRVIRLAERLLLTGDSTQWNSV